MKEFQIGFHAITVAQLAKTIHHKTKIVLLPEVEEAVVSCRKFLDDKIKRTENPIYGINTGFGSLCNIKIDATQLEQLQQNLVMSHACGAGDEVPADVVRLMLLLKIQNMALGHSGVQLSTVHALIKFYNEDCLPIIYQLGSLGASGDLAPLAHLALPLLGMGEVSYKGKRMSALLALQKMNLNPVQLASKEGLALLNGTQFMSSYGVHSLVRAYKISYLADVIAALSLEAYDGRPEAFDAKIHQIRPHRGQLQTAKNILDMLEGSEIINRPKEHVQDPYSFRCVPQVHGASKDTLHYSLTVVETEINSVTDNPLIFPEEDDIISGGNFHGQPLALVFDFLAIAMAELANISERRIYQLINGKRGLPPFLVEDAGLNSGFMIPQYTAASIVSQNKQLCTPASIDSIESSNGQEDHVSMGANAATKLSRVLDNVERVLAIELMCASQALHFRKEKTSPFLQQMLDEFRVHVPILSNDRYLHADMEKALEFVKGLDVADELLYQ